MNIIKVYEQYNLLPNLQEHMIRVAAVAFKVIESSTQELEKENILSACLLHDMGNIIKFDLSLFPHFLEPEGLEYWQSIQSDFIDRYGSDEHTATFEICRELGVSDRVQELVEGVGFSQAEERYNDPDLNKKICMYCDHRVTPNGVVSLEHRIDEGLKRFMINKKIKDTPENYKKRIELARFAKKVEDQIFTVNELIPSDITDEAIEPYIKKLSDFNLDTKI